MKYKTVLFDLDGTALDTLDDLTDSINYCLSKYNLPLRPKSDIRRFLGHGIKNLVTRSFEGSNVDIEEAFKMFAAYYKDHASIKTKPYEGIVELIKELKSKGIKVGLVSNKADIVVKELAKDYFENQFDYVLGQREDILKKPAPDMVYHAIKTLNGNLNDSIYIGDSEVDFETALNANMDCLLVSYGFRDREELEKLNSKYLVDSVLEIKEILL